MHIPFGPSMSNLFNFDLDSASLKHMLENIGDPDQTPCTAVADRHCFIQGYPVQGIWIVEGL